MQSLDVSLRGNNAHYQDIINSIDFANKITAKQFMKQTLTDTEARIIINKLHDQPPEETFNQSQLDQQGKKITIKSTLKINALQEKQNFRSLLNHFLMVLLISLYFITYKFADCFYQT